MRPSIEPDVFKRRLRARRARVLVLPHRRVERSVYDVAFGGHQEGRRWAGCADLANDLEIGVAVLTRAL